MKVVELKGKDIMMAYDGHILSNDFGYSCANFNVKDHFGLNGSENDEAMFDFYTTNPNNISCIVAYNNRNKISGRRMFFKGKSIINDSEFEYPIKQGNEIKYLYGYYGTRINEAYSSINKYFASKYMKGIVYTDKGVIKNGNIDITISNFWIMQVERSNFNKYPPIDILHICPELKSLANFNPRQYVLDVIEKDYNMKNLSFHQAYRYNPNKKTRKYDYKTWSDNYKLIDDEEEEDNYLD